MSITERVYAAERPGSPFPDAIRALLSALRRSLAPVLRGTRFGSLPAEQIEGWTNRSELNWLWQQAKRRHVIVEIGSWKGRSTHAIASATPGILFFVEHFRGSQEDDHQYYPETESADGVESVRQVLLENVGPYVKAGRAILLDMKSAAAAKTLAPILMHRRADMIFIDADHSYESVADDIRNWRPLLHSGGLLCGHDSDWPGVRKALDELVPGWKHGPGSIWYLPC